LPAVGTNLNLALMKNLTFQRILLVVLLTPVLVFSAWLGYNILTISAERAEIKNDYSEINNIQYGLLSVDAWRDHITAIVTEQIQSFSFSPQQEAALRGEINAVLNALVTQAETMIDQKQKRIDKKIKKFMIKTFVKTDKVRKQIPVFTQTIIDELKKPQSKEKLMFLAKDKLKDFAAQTHDSLSQKSNLGLILIKYNVPDVPTFNATIGTQVKALQDRTYFLGYVLLGCLVFVLLMWLVLRNQYALHTPLFIISVLMALIVLGVGLSTPMIEIDARIKELNFVLIGKHLVFSDQVLFFQSKSILDVVHIMLSTRKPDSIAVGFLILLFSVLFPVTKLISTKIYLLGSEKIRNNKIIKFFVFKSGKWSMADVMVVAIFMSYIGFKGILDSQMDIMNMKSDSLATISTNDTSLQPGFILFVAYVVFGLILAEILKWITSRSPELLADKNLHPVAPTTVHSTHMQSSI
jgi:Paraquat-inducible protein A